MSRWPCLRATFARLRKNLDTVLQALVGASGVHLAVVGAREGSPYPALAERLGVADRVHFLGFRRDMAQIMQAVDIFVFPSRYEPFGIVVLEAMASGVPVILAATVGAAEVVTPDCGVVLPDPEDAGWTDVANVPSGARPSAASRYGRGGAGHC